MQIGRLKASPLIFTKKLSHQVKADRCLCAAEWRLLADCSCSYQSSRGNGFHHIGSIIEWDDCALCWPCKRISNAFKTL